MATNNYVVAVYVKHEAKQFSITARPVDHADFPAMDAMEVGMRLFIRLDIAIGLTKQQADLLKVSLEAAYRAAEYRRVHRPKPLRNTNV
jgi:hypothetical protein